MICPCSSTLVTYQMCIRDRITSEEYFSHRDTNKCIPKYILMFFQHWNFMYMCFYCTQIRWLLYPSGQESPMSLSPVFVPPSRFFSPRSSTLNYTETQVSFENFFIVLTTTYRSILHDQSLLSFQVIYSIVIIFCNCFSYTCLLYTSRCV